MQDDRGPYEKRTDQFSRLIREKRLSIQQIAEMIDVTSLCRKCHGIGRNLTKEQFEKIDVKKRMNPLIKSSKNFKIIININYGLSLNTMING